MSMRTLRLQRRPLLICSSLTALVAGIWTIVAVAFGAGYGTGAGLIATGIAGLVIEGLTT